LSQQEIIINENNQLKKELSELISKHETFVQRNNQVEITTEESNTQFSDEQEEVVPEEENNKKTSLYGGFLYYLN